MQKERKVIESNAVIVFDRDVTVSELNKLMKDFFGDVVITGELWVNTYPDIKSNLYVMGNIVCIPEQELILEGDLYCYSEMASYDINVNGSFYCEGTISADNIKVSESFCCKNKIEAYEGKITVLGDFECHGIKAATVECFAETYMEGPIFVSKLIKSGY